ncbi:acyl-ACP thioesterase domain-containing protein [Enterococcus olivae]
MAAKYTIPHEVAYYECDVNGTMTLSSMVAVAIRVSEEQSEQLGRGTEFVHQFGLTWIITNYQLFIERLPKVGEKIQIMTQAKEYNKYFCYRTFWILTEKGEELVRIETIFVLMNMETRKMSSVPEEITTPYESEKTKKIKRFPKIEKIENGQQLPFRVRFYDIDGNQHVNNAVYFNWVLDVLGYDFLTHHVPKYMHIRFDKEVEYGNEIESHFEVISETFKTRHEIKIGDQTYCEANIEWQEKD